MQLANNREKDRDSEEDWRWANSVLGELILAEDLPATQRHSQMTVFCRSVATWPQGRTVRCVCREEEQVV